MTELIGASHSPCVLRRRAYVSDAQLALQSLVVGLGQELLEAVQLAVVLLQEVDRGWDLQRGVADELEQA